MIIFIYTRKPRFFSDRRHRLLRDESFEHPVDCGSRRGLSTDSRRNHEFFIVLPRGKVSRLRFEQTERETVALWLLFYPARSRSNVEAQQYSGSQPNFAPRARNRRRLPKRPCDLPEVYGPFPN